MDHLTGDDGTYAFVATTQAGRPVAWDPCEPIHYVVNPTGAPDDWEDTVEDAVDGGQRRERLRVRVRRHHGRPPVHRPRLTGADDDAPPVLIGWADASEVPELEGHDGRHRRQHPAAQRRARALRHRDRGARRRRLRPDGGHRATTDAERLILAHELGHVLGLDHVDDVGELMNPEYVGQRGFGDGDRKGFGELHGQPCG